MQAKGKAHKLGDHIDTDAIIPAIYLVSTDPEELGSHCMEGLEPGWIKRTAPGDVMVAGENFGCGSSREHAPVSILGAGVPVVVAKSFARIFYRNSFNMGLILMELGDAADRISDGDELEIDTEQGVVKNLTTGETLKTNPVPEFMQKIASAGGLAGYVKQRLAERA
ncbi:MAG: 3-isopropylmalate/(R)-2-methylmalate dehydratase small subunit [Desulfovibrionales bacterium]|jgi:3-isopropylmalate/(R)-2-methylmalate dehydratase small subunit|nr:3-isopropylmalate/(R)-2-methylmalate dehydratase small subunit [Desulfovibrionales bacterium]